MASPPAPYEISLGFISPCLLYKRHLRERHFIFIIINVSRNLEQAADTAYQLKSIEELNSVLMKCGGNRAMAEKVQMLKAQLTERR